MTKPDPMTIALTALQAKRDAAITAAYAECVEIARAHRSKIEINEPLWHEGQDWASDRISDAILARAAAVAANLATLRLGFRGTLDVQFDHAVKANPALIGVEPFVLPPPEDRGDMEVFAFHRGKWRHVKWSKHGWSLGYGQPFIRDGNREFRPMFPQPAGSDGFYDWKE